MPVTSQKSPLHFRSHHSKPIFYVYGEDLLQFSDANGLQINLGSDFFYMTQRPMQTITITNNANIDYTGLEDNASHELTENILVEGRQYFQSPRSIFIGESGLSVFNTNEDNIDNRSTGAILFNAEVGYGRGFDVRVIAQAAMLCTKLNKDKKNCKKLKVEM